MIHLTLLLTLWPGLGCKGEPQPADSEGVVSGDRLPEAPSDDWMEAVPESLYTPSPPGVHGGPDSVFDPSLSDAVTAYGDCAALLAGCVEESEGDFSGCVATVAICQSDEPWNEGSCCPSACEDRFDEYISAGREPYDAYLLVYALEPDDCFPSLEVAP